MNKINNIAPEYAKIFVDLSENSDKEWSRRLDDLNDDLSVKAENTAVYIRSLMRSAEELRRKEDILRARRKAAENISEKLKGYLIERMENAGVRKFEMPRAYIALKNNGESVKITDEVKFIGWAKSSDNGHLLKFNDPVISKTAVKECLRKGENIPYAELVRTETLMIK